jgi:classical protein kinase C
LVKKRDKRFGAVKKKKRGHIQLAVHLSRMGTSIELTCEVQPPPLLCDSGADRGAVDASRQVMGAVKLLPADFSGLADPYVKMYLHPHLEKTTKKKGKVPTAAVSL